MKVIPRMGLAVLGATVVATTSGLATYALTDEPPPTAVTRLTLTTEVYWPYYDAVRQEQTQLLEQPDTTEALAVAAAPGELLSVGAELPGNQSFFDVHVAATTETAALAASAAAVDLLLESDLEVVNVPLRARVAELEAAIGPLKQELDRYGDTFPPERQRAETRYTEMLFDLDELRVQVASPPPRIAPLTDPELDDQGDVRTRNAKVAAAIGFLAALTGTRAWDARRRTS